MGKGVNIEQARAFALAPLKKKKFSSLRPKPKYFPKVLIRRLIYAVKAKCTGKGIKAVGRRPEVLSKVNVDGALYPH